MPDFGLKKIEVEGVSKLWIVGILLTVLKIIGLISLGLLILLLVIAALFLFVPCVYRFRVSYNDDEFELNGKVNFLNIIRAGFGYKDKLYYDLKTLFFTLASSEKKGGNEKENINKDKEEVKEYKTETLRESTIKGNKEEKEKKEEKKQETETKKRETLTSVTEKTADKDEEPEVEIKEKHTDTEENVLY